MKYFLMLSLFVGWGLVLNAQTVNKTTKKTRVVKKTNPVQRGTGQYYGSKDTTPGSPMGTGGAGGGDMSGSPAGSAIQTDDQTTKAATTNPTTTTKKQTIRKAKRTRSGSMRKTKS